MEVDSGGGDTVEAIITCNGHIDDPSFKKHFTFLLIGLKKLLSASLGKGAELVVRKMEPWNSVRVTFSVSREAALRLRHLAQQGDATLRTLGILTVQVEGDQVVSMTLAGRNNGPPQEIVLRTEEPGQAATSAPAQQQRSLAELMSAANGVERLQPAAGAGAAPLQPTAGAGPSQLQTAAFRSPNVVAPGSQPLPYPAAKLPQRAAATYPFNSMSHAAAAAVQHRELAPSPAAPPQPQPPPPYPGGGPQPTAPQQHPQLMHHPQPLGQQQLVQHQQQPAQVVQQQIVHQPTTQVVQQQMIHQQPAQVVQQQMLQHQQQQQQAAQVVHQQVVHQVQHPQASAPTSVAAMMVVSGSAAAVGAPTPPATPSPAPMQTPVPVQQAAVTTQQLAKQPPLTTMGSPLLVNLLKSEASAAASADSPHLSHLSRVQSHSPLPQPQQPQPVTPQQAAAAAARLAHPPGTQVRVALKQRASPVLQTAPQRGSPIQQLVRRSPPVMAPRASSPAVQLQATATVARHSPISQPPLRASPVQLASSPAARPPAAGLMRPHATHVALMTHPGRHHVQAAAAAVSNLQQVGNGGLVQVNNGPTRLVHPPTRTYSNQPHHLKHQPAAAGRPSLHPTLPNSATAARHQRPEPVVRQPPPPPSAVPAPGGALRPPAATSISSAGFSVSAASSASSTSMSSGLQHVQQRRPSGPGAALAKSSSHHLSPGGSHQSGKPRQLLINPLTGLLEPMPTSDSSSDSEPEPARSPFPDANSNSVFSDDGSVSNQSLPCMSDSEASKMSLLSGVSEPARRVSRGGTPSPRPVSTSPAAEKIKLRLKLEKAEPVSPVSVSPTYNVVSFVNATAGGISASAGGGSAALVRSRTAGNGGGLVATVSTAEEPRVPPLHISLRGRSGAVVVPKDGKAKDKVKQSRPGKSTKDKAGTSAGAVLSNSVSDVSVSGLLVSEEAPLKIKLKDPSVAKARAKDKDKLKRVKRKEESGEKLFGSGGAPALGNAVVKVAKMSDSGKDASASVVMSSAPPVASSHVPPAHPPLPVPKDSISNHVFGLHDDLDPKHIPPVPPEDIFSHDTWEPPPPPMRLPPDTAATCAAPPAASSASLALTVAASLSPPAKLAPPAATPVTVATVSCVHVPAASVQLESALRTGAVRIDSSSDGLRKEVLTQCLERKVNDVCGTQAAAARLAGADGGATGAPATPHATRVDGGLDSPSVTPKGDPVNGQGEDSGIESMDTQSEKSPNQEQSPQHRKEELDSHEKHHYPHQAPPVGTKMDLSTTDQALERVPSRTFKTESIRVSGVATHSTVAAVSCAPVVSSSVSASVVNLSSASTDDKVQLVIKVNKPKSEVNPSSSSNSLSSQAGVAAGSGVLNSPKPPPEPSGSATINVVPPSMMRPGSCGVSRLAATLKSEPAPAVVSRAGPEPRITDSLALSRISSIAAELERGAEASVAQRSVAVNYAAAGGAPSTPTPAAPATVAATVVNPSPALATVSEPVSSHVQVKPVAPPAATPSPVKTAIAAKPAAVTVKIEAPEADFKLVPPIDVDTKASVKETVTSSEEVRVKTEPPSAQPEVKRKTEPTVADRLKSEEPTTTKASTPASSSEDDKPSVSSSSTISGRTTPMTLPPGSKMLPIKLIKAVNSPASSRTGACSPQTPVPPRSTASVAAAAPLVPTPPRAVTEHRETSPEPPVLSPAVTGGDIRPTPVRRSDSKELPPELENPDEPELLRVKPPLYTYSNPDKARDISPMEENAEEEPIVNAKQTSEILNEILLQKEAVSKVESDHSYLKPSRKSIEESLSIQIPPEADASGDAEKRPTRSTRANSRLHSPNTTAVASPTTTTAPSAKASPQPRTTATIATPSPSAGARSTSSKTRRRCESGSSNASAADDTVTSATTPTPSRRADTPDAGAEATGSERSRRRCSENAAGLIKACMGVEEHKTRPSTPNSGPAVNKADTPRRARTAANKKDDAGSDDEFDRRSTRSTDESSSHAHRPNHRAGQRTNHAGGAAAASAGTSAAAAAAATQAAAATPVKAEKPDDRAGQERSTGRASRARTRESSKASSRSGSAESLDGATGGGGAAPARKAKAKGAATRASVERDPPTAGTPTPPPPNNVSKRKLRNSAVGLNDNESTPAAKRRRLSRDK